MSVNVISRPSNFASVYVPVEWEFLSSSAGVAGNLSWFEETDDGKLKVRFDGVTQPRSRLFVGGILTITNNDTYNGEYLVTDTETSATLELDTPFLGSSFGGNMSYSLSNINIVCDLYVNGSFVVRKFRFANLNNRFVFDFSKELQIELGNNMSPSPLGDVSINEGSESYASVYVKYAQVHDELIDGIPTQTFTLDQNQSPPDLFNDSANAITVINSTVPYLEWALGSVKNEIINIDTGLDSFIVDSVASNRFLTNSPKNITISNGESYELSVIIDHNAAVSYTRQVVTFDSSGAGLTVIRTVFSPGVDSVWVVPCGTDNFAPLLPSNAVKYEVSIVDSNNNFAAMSEVVTFNIDTKCYGSRTRFVWLNPRGGYDAFTFLSSRKLSSSVSKGSFNPTRSYPVTIGTREEATTSVTAIDSITTGTNKVSREVAEWLQELLESPQVFIELDSGNPLHSNRVPVTLINKTRSICDTYSGLFNVNLRYKFAFEKIGLRAY